MIVSELIRELQHLQKVYGDVNVYIHDTEWRWDFPLKEVYIREAKENLKYDRLIYPNLPLRITLAQYEILEEK